jgi:hypothetical protein
MSSYLPFFCTKCGAKIDWKDRATGRFHETLGEPMFKTVAICPNYRYAWDGHANEQGDPHPHAPEEGDHPFEEETDE